MIVTESSPALTRLMTSFTSASKVLHSSFNVSAGVRQFGAVFISSLVDCGDSSSW